MTTDNFLANIGVQPVFNSDGTTRFKFIYPPTQEGTTFAASERTIGELMNKSDEYKCEKPYNKMFLNGGSVVFEFVRPGSFGQTREVIPRITDVKTYDDKVVKVLFADGTYEKAVLSENDTFSLEQGVSICLTKKLLSKIVGSDFSGSAYNKIVDYALRELSDDSGLSAAVCGDNAAELEALRSKGFELTQQTEKRMNDTFLWFLIIPALIYVVWALLSDDSESEDNNDLDNG